MHPLPRHEGEGAGRGGRGGEVCGKIAILACIAALAGCEGRAPHADAEGGRRAKPIALDGPVVAEIDLTRGVSEARASSFFGATSQRSHVDLVRALRALAQGGGDPPAKGVLVRLGSGSAGLASAQEIGALLGVVRKAMPVVCHADEYGNATMMLAARGCSKIWVSPAGGVESIGIAAQMIYVQPPPRAAARRVDFLQIGKYKGAEEPFTRDGPSPEARASLEGALRGMRAAWLDGIAEGRGKPEAAAAASRTGPTRPRSAVARGLVDAVGYPDEARDDAKKLAGADRVASRFGSGEGPRRRLARPRRRAPRHRRVDPRRRPPRRRRPRRRRDHDERLALAARRRRGITEHDLGRIVARSRPTPRRRPSCSASTRPAARRSRPTSCGRG